MITILPNKLKSMRQILKFERIIQFYFVLKSIPAPFLGSQCAVHGTCATR